MLLYINKTFVSPYKSLVKIRSFISFAGRRDSFGNSLISVSILINFSSPYVINRSLSIKKDTGDVPIFETWKFIRDLVSSDREHFFSTLIEYPGLSYDCKKYLSVKMRLYRLKLKKAELNSDLYLFYSKEIKALEKRRFDLSYHIKKPPF